MNRDATEPTNGPALTARYDAVASTYASGDDDYSLTATQALLELAGDVRNSRVLDLACGSGLITRKLARDGAADVVGIDISTGLLERASLAERAEPLGTTYFVIDASAPDILPGRSFDLVVCSFGLSDIDDLDGTCRNVARLLRTGGRFVFSILHPCFPGVHDVSSSWPTGGRYYDEGWWRADGELSSLRQQVGANHRTVSTYLNSLARVGLLVDRMLEPPPNEDFASRSADAGAYPLYLAVRCRLVPETAD